MNWFNRIWILTIGALIFQSLYYWPRLPEQMASHFDASGAADNYASRPLFMLIWFLSLALVNIGPVIIGPLIRKFPARFINTPNKDYWLATPERRERLIRIVRNMLAGALLGANILLLLVFQYTVNYNIGHRTMSINTVWFALAAETLLSLFAVAWGLIRLSNPPDDRAPQPLS